MYDGVCAIIAETGAAASHAARETIWGAGATALECAHAASRLATRGMQYVLIEGK